jgi:predicted enzyme related to lactoylglutathione lyase
MNNPVCWFEIYVQEMERARAFYETVFQLQLQRLEGSEFDMWAFPGKPEANGAAGALIKIPGYPSGNNSVVIYFSCDDCALQAERAVKAGGRIETAKKSIGPYGYMVLINDTEGNVIGLHSLQ